MNTGIHVGAGLGLQLRYPTWPFSQCSSVQLLHKKIHVALMYFFVAHFLVYYLYE